jgi:hypothetical protein
MARVRGAACVCVPLKGRTRGLACGCVRGGPLSGPRASSTWLASLTPTRGHSARHQARPTPPKEHTRRTTASVHCGAQELTRQRQAQGLLAHKLHCTAPPEGHNAARVLVVCYPPPAQCSLCHAPLLLPSPAAGPPRFQLPSLPLARRHTVTSTPTHVV